MNMWSNDGGFMEGGTMNASQFASPTQEKKEKRTQNIVPVTAKMIHDAEGDCIVIGDCEVHMIVLVGIIRSVDVSSTKITYTIYDSTGVIEGVQWLESESDFNQDSQKKPLMEMTYCKVTGTLRTQVGKKHLMIFNIVPITDINRVTTHILEVIHDSMKLRQLQSRKRNGGPTPGKSNVMMNEPSGENTHGLQGPLKVVYQIIKTYGDEVGIHRKQIYETLKEKISPAHINKVLDDLSSEALIFCSIDEDHFKTADM